MSVRTWLQDHPAPLVVAWQLTEAVFKPFKPVFTAGYRTLVVAHEPF